MSTNVQNPPVMQVDVTDAGPPKFQYPFIQVYVTKLPGEYNVRVWYCALSNLIGVGQFIAEKKKRL